MRDMKGVISRASNMSATHTRTLGVFNSCLFLSSVCTFCSGFDTKVRDTSRPRALMRKEAALTIPTSTSSAEQSSAEPALVQGGEGEGYHFWPVAPDVECTAEYYTRTVGTTPSLCAHECFLEGGCLIFSWSAGHRGCRISMCSNSFAQDQTGVGCGESEGKTMKVASGCKTGQKPQGALFVISKGGPVLQTVEPGWAKPIAPYLLLQTEVMCGKRYNKVSASDAGECAVKCSKSIGCWMFSFGVSSGCRLSACLDTEATDATGTCGKTPTLGILGFSTQCEVDNDADSGTYLSLSFNIQAVDSGCKGQYKEMDGTRSPYECRHFCIAQEGCRIFSYGETNGCRISTCFDLDIHGTERAEVEEVAGDATSLVGITARGRGRGRERKAPELLEGLAQGDQGLVAGDQDILIPFAEITAMESSTEHGGDASRCSTSDPQVMQPGTFTKSSSWKISLSRPFHVHTLRLTGHKHQSVEDLHHIQIYVNSARCAGPTKMDANASLEMGCNVTGSEISVQHLGLSNVTVCSLQAYGKVPQIPASMLKLEGDCNWLEEDNKFLGGFAHNETNNMTLDDAKNRCQHLGKHKCGGVTCMGDVSDGKCTVRNDWVPQAAAAFTSPTSFIPNLACYKEVIKGTGHMCGMSDNSGPSSEGQCYVGASPKDYVYNINSKDTLALYQTLEKHSSVQQRKTRRPSLRKLKRKQTDARQRKQKWSRKSTTVARVAAERA
mmetsp:Transcript_103429/g.179495  ORF Transcript_103429/g.179495 Transcript_103429/m.179495 type:complete len:723 (-) Transcript_103429:56-2224(-)